MDQKPGIRSTPIADLTLHPDNPRHGDIGAIMQSIEQNGFVGVLVAQCSSGHVITGNHRMQAAANLGFTKLKVEWKDCSDEEALRLLLADNRTSDLATNDDAVVADLLMALAESEAGFDGTGYDGDDLDALIRQMEYDQRELGDVMDEWVGMPDYDQPNRERAYRTIVSFETDADADKFFEVMGISKTMDFWYPHDSLANSTGLDKKWINDAD